MAGTAPDPFGGRNRGPRSRLERAPLKPRNRELLNLVLATAVGGSAFASAWIVRAGTVDSDWAPYVGMLAGLYLVAHLLVRYTAPLADPMLLPAAGLLTAIGLTVIYRLDPQSAKKQVVWVAIGLAIFAVILLLLRFDHRTLERYKYLFGVTALVLLLLPSLPRIGPFGGVRVNDARLWFEVGSLQFQPGEFAKILMVVFLAAYLRDKRESLARGRPKDIGPLLVIWGASMLVLVQTSDLGSALLNFGIFLAMIYVATGRTMYVVGGTALFVGGAVGLYHAIDRVQQRVTVWLHPWTSTPVFCPLNGQMELRQNCDSYQLVKSLYSVANGGFGGTGIGKGTFTSIEGAPLIPYLNTDFVYSAIAQEVGLIGASAMLLVIMVMVVRGMRISLIAQDGFSKLLAAGLTFGFALQTFIIVGGVLRVVPLTGITLPFVSYGGSSILSNFALLALLLLVSHRAAYLARAR